MANFSPLHDARQTAEPTEELSAVNFRPAHNNAESTQMVDGDDEDDTQFSTAAVVADIFETLRGAPVRVQVDAMLTYMMNRGWDFAEGERKTSPNIGFGDGVTASTSSMDMHRPGPSG